MRATVYPESLLCSCFPSVKLLPMFKGKKSLAAIAFFRERAPGERAFS